MFLPQFQAAGNPGVDGGDKEKGAVMTLGRTQAVGAGGGAARWWELSPVILDGGPCTLPSLQGCWGT